LRRKKESEQTHGQYATAAMIAENYGYEILTYQHREWSRDFSLILISATSTDFPTSSEQVSPWDPKTHFHDFVLALVGAFLPQTQWAILKKIPALPPARKMKNHPSDYLAKDNYPDFFLVTEIIFSNYLRQLC
jgi:hypothetical protein